MAQPALRKFIIALAALALGAVPASAQMYSDGYKFLQAVKDKDGDKATSMLNEPGSTVVNARDLSTGETALHYTVRRRDNTWTGWLLQQRANPNIADKQGVTPLGLAIRMNFLEGVQTLIDGGARVDETDFTGQTPLISAVLSRNGELVELLLKANANPDKTDNAGRSARDYAGERGAERMRLLIEQHDNAADADPAAGRIYGPSF
ncbi:ankyrin repeat domain-containing protein [Aurantiacibacter xanthus]|nr:ankyrin repeat domain-containing protein [Aurantiacibacter xanthus]